MAEHSIGALRTPWVFDLCRSARCTRSTQHPKRSLSTVGAHPVRDGYGLRLHLRCVAHRVRSHSGCLPSRPSAPRPSRARCTPTNSGPRSR